MIKYLLLVKQVLPPTSKSFASIFFFFAEKEATVFLINLLLASIIFFIHSHILKIATIENEFKKRSKITVPHQLWCFLFI